MEIKVFKTLVKENTRLGSSAYVLGKIDGFKTVLCDIPNGVKGYASIRQGKVPGIILITKCTQEQYDIFKQLTEDYFPGVCEFEV